MQRSTKEVRVSRIAAPDLARQVQALLLVLGYAPKTKGPGVCVPEPALTQQSSVSQAAATASIPTQQRRKSQ